MSATAAPKKAAKKPAAAPKKAAKKPAAAPEDEKDDLDVVIFFEGDYYYLKKDDWQAARKLGQGEASVLGPLVSHGAVVAHVDADHPKYGTWTNLLNLSAIQAACKVRKNR
jgi:hypothetical protein